MQNAVPAAEAAPLTNPTLATLMDIYLADRRNPFAERKCKHPESLASHLKVCRTLWGEMTLNEFRQGSKARVKATCADWRAGGLSPHTCRKRISILKTVFRFAVDEEIIDRGQEPIIKLPPNGAPRERVLDHKAELPALMRAADSSKTPFHVRLNCELSIRTGQRQGAIADLQWSKHIDFENRVILFRETECAEDRSKKRRTNIPMDDELYALLLDAKERAESDYVIEWRGKKVKNAYVGMKALYKRAGIENLHRHDLRRTAATYVHRGTEGDMKAAASFIGDTEQMAQKHYVQQSAETLLRPVGAIASVLGDARAAARIAKHQSPDLIGLYPPTLALMRELLETEGEWIWIYETDRISANVLEDYGLIECHPSLLEEERHTSHHRPFMARTVPGARDKFSPTPITDNVGFVEVA